jgi:hypothetical protein
MVLEGRGRLHACRRESGILMIPNERKPRHMFSGISESAKSQLFGSGSGTAPPFTALEDAQLFKAPEALAVWVAMASIKAGDKAS